MIRSHLRCYVLLLQDVNTVLINHSTARRLVHIVLTFASRGGETFGRCVEAV